MNKDELAALFNDAMSDIRYGFFTHLGSTSEQKIFAEGMAKMDNFMHEVAPYLDKQVVSSVGWPPPEDLKPAKCSSTS